MIRVLNSNPGKKQKKPVILEPKIMTSATNAKFAVDGHCNLQCHCLDSVYPKR
jgi:hypothetical protein